MHIIFLIFHICDRIWYLSSNRFHEFYNLQYLKSKHANIGKGCHFIGKHLLVVPNTARIKFGDGFISRSGFKNHIKGEELTSFWVSEGATLSIGNNAGISCTTIACCNRIEIGNNTNIGAGCLIMDSNFHSSDWRTRSDRTVDKDLKSKTVIIGDNVFVGANCIITKGVTIGDKSMVAAGSVVVNDIPPGELWGGNPAKFIKNVI